MRDLERNEVPGLIIEAGTARGGSAIVMAAAKDAMRPMKVYDVFGMIPPPTDRDGEDVHKRYAKISGGAAKGVGGDEYYGYRDDLYGEVLDVLHQARRHRIEPDDQSWAIQQVMLANLERRWREPDEGIWEVRGPRRHFTHSKVMAWVAMDRAIKAVEEFGLPGDAAGFQNQGASAPVDLFAVDLEHSCCCLLSSLDRPHAAHRPVRIGAGPAPIYLRPRHGRDVRHSTGNGPRAQGTQRAPHTSGVGGGHAGVDGDMQQRLGWDAAAVQAGPAQAVALDEADGQAELGCAERRCVTARARAEHQVARKGLEATGIEIETTLERAHETEPLIQASRVS